MLKKAVAELYENFPFETRLNYSGKFKPYRANVRLRQNILTFSLSKTWKSISEEIQIGLIQELLLKILRKKLKPIKTTTGSMELYSIFLKKVHLGIPKTKKDPILENSFDRVNEKYFYGLMETPNLVWGNKSSTKFGQYEYGTDTITINPLLKGELLDYVMYHEMLHKKHKFRSKNGRSYHHTKEFRKSEKQFENSEEMERQLSRLARRSMIKRAFFGF